MTIEELARKAINGPNAHVRRFVPIIWLTIDGLNRHGIQWSGRNVRQINIGLLYYAKYKHPTQHPRGHASIEIRERMGARRVMHEIKTIDDAIAFRASPPHFLFEA